MRFGASRVHASGSVVGRTQALGTLPPPDWPLYRSYGAKDYIGSHNPTGSWNTHLAYYPHLVAEFSTLIEGMLPNQRRRVEYFTYPLQ